MAMETQPVVLPDGTRRMIDESFQQALEYINKIHAPLQLADKAKANRLAKISYDLAQLHKEAHMDDTISLLAPTRSDLGLTEKMSPIRIFESTAALQGNEKQAVLAQPSHGFGNHSQEQQFEEKQEKPTWAEVASSGEIPKKGHNFSKSQAAVMEQHTKEKVYKTAVWRQQWKEGEEDQRRTVEVYHLPKSYTLRHLTNKIHEGPLILIEMIDEREGNTKCAMIVFMKAEDAKSFVLKNEAIRAEMGENQSCYGPGVNVGWGNPYPKPEGVFLMEGKGGARRRLTFSGRQLFSRIRPAQFYLDIAALAEKKNIELVWLFNSGNATVVFSNIGTAVALKEWFQEKSSKPGPYQGATVTFSADLCEAHIPLVTQMPGGGAVEV